MKKKIISYTIVLVVALALILLVCGLKGLFTEEKSRIDVISALCDAFFVAGVVVIGIGALIWASDKGAFDGLGYSISSLFNLHKPAGKGLNWKKSETYEEYVERKHAPEKKNKSMNMLLIIGAVLLLIAIIFLIVYMTTK